MHRAYSKFNRQIIQRTTRNLNVVKGNGVIGELLIFFVPFARNQDQVARLRHRRGTSNRFRAVRDFLVMGRAKSFLDVVNDCVRIFLARIVGGDDGVVGQFIGHARHQWPLFSITIATAPEDHDKFAGFQFPKRVQDITQSVIGVGVVNKDLELASRRYEFESPREPIRSS